MRICPLRAFCKRFLWNRLSVGNMVILDDLCQLGAKCLLIEILLMVGKTIIVEMLFLFRMKPARR